MPHLTGKIAIVTGASRGIGRAIAQRLAQDGASVVINYTQSAESAKEVVSAIEANGGKAFPLQADITQIAEIHRLFEETLYCFGHLDILVNNAGITIVKPLTQVTEAEFDEVFALNTKGLFFSMQEAAHNLADGGRIVNISTVGTVNSAPGFSIYTGSKAAVEQFTLAAAKELGKRGITVNTVSPGSTNTEMFRHAAPPDMQLQAAQMSPLGRIGQPEDVADVVAFLVSDQARWLTGQNIHASGGVTG